MDSSDDEEGEEGKVATVAREDGSTSVPGALVTRPDFKAVVEARAAVLPDGSSWVAGDSSAAAAAAAAAAESGVAAGGGGGEGGGGVAPSATSADMAVGLTPEDVAAGRVLSVLSPELLTDYAGRPAHVHQEALVQLMSAIVGALNRPRVWEMQADLEFARGNESAARECLQRQCRALQLGSWERGPESAFRAVVKAGDRLVRELVREGSHASLVSARMFVAGIVHRAEIGEVFARDPVVAAWRAKIQDLERLEAAKRSA